MIYYTGDIHGEMLHIRDMVTKYEITDQDVIVILGDVGMNYYGNNHGDQHRKKKLNKAVVSFAAEGTCSPLAFGAVIEYPTLCRAASDKNAYLSAMQDRLLSRVDKLECLPEVRNLHRDNRGCERVPVLLLYPPPRVQVPRHQGKPLYLT